LSHANPSISVAAAEGVPGIPMTIALKDPPELVAEVIAHRRTRAMRGFMPKIKGKARAHIIPLLFQYNPTNGSKDNRQNNCNHNIRSGKVPRASIK